MQWVHEGAVPTDPGTALSSTDPGLELESVIERLARLVLNGQALAGRKAAAPHDAERLSWLRAGVLLGQRAIAAAVTDNAS